MIGKTFPDTKKKKENKENKKNSPIFRLGFKTIKKETEFRSWEARWPMVSMHDSGASGPGSSPGRGQCVLFLGKTL